ncbi:MAG: DNA-directed RNA polymerase subunit beta' [Eubacteriales bacterium]|nr:DNA-directed RNA polymerase subunit beta' [Eubacteriales bacterium]MDD3866255.1 DNA-directed RNA polymerase subunit beta' [Eubacteriales bacterium]
MHNQSLEMNNFEAIGIALASPEKILEWSRGEVKKPETINYRTLKPERDGLFCEKIFGPTKDWECHCGKYKKIRYKGIVCDRCGVEVTKSKVRRERLGHIKLAAPVSHIWYFRGIPSRMGLILDMSPRNLEKVLYFAAYVVIDPGMTSFTPRQVITDREYREAVENYGKNAFRAKMGAEAVKELLAAINIDEMAEQLREEFRSASGQKKVRIVKRLEVVEAFKKSGNHPDWMVLDVLPVLPPELRPMVQLDGGRFATSDLNDLYRRVINRNNRLNKLLQLGAPEIIVRNEKRMLQEAVDALIDNGRRGRPVTGAGNRALKSLSDMLKGKQGRFRQNLLGKRVDYSGRSVIVVGPELKLHQCGLPKEMALELFKPFVMKKIVQAGHAHNIKTARRLVDRANDIVWDILEEVIKDHPVLLNRAPTLHRLGIQAFEPVLVEGRAIKLHPLVCTAYNADFDGDQMAVHVPLSAEAQAEARFLMLSANNLLKPQDGKPVTVPTQDMVLGCYYLTIDREGAKGEGKVFSSVNEAVMAYDTHELDLHARIKVRTTRDFAGRQRTAVVESTLGRFIFNEIIPQDLGFVDRSDPANEMALECDFLVGKKELGLLVERCVHQHGISVTAALLDRIKTLGYHYSTVGGISIGIFDMIVPDVKKKHITEAEEKVDYINRQHQRGLLNDTGRYEAVVKIWRTTTDDITEALKNSLGRFNPVYMMSQSGARGNINQIKQLAGMRGNMSDTSGKTIEIPIKSNLREGMNVLEFFISSHGSRKALSDTALKTADSGYLTRRLVDVSQDVIIRENDCGTDEYIDVSAVTVGSTGSRRIVESLVDRITGRYAAKDLTDPKTGELIVAKNELITYQIATRLEAMDIKTVAVRSVLACRARHGICARCYGVNLASGEPAVGGEAVGIMAAQSIGEPGTQLTMRTFHTGGIASGDDITQGLPRVEELFEARKPKGQATISELDGVVKVEETGKRKREVTVTASDGEAVTYTIPLSAPLSVSSGDVIEAGDLLTDGSVNPHDIMRIKGVRGVQKYIIHEVLKVYKNNGVEINDKHIEIITRQMMRKIRVDDPGDTELMTGSLVDMFDFELENDRAMTAGLNPASGKRVLLGITKASLATDSFLSAASFQETTRVLTDAAVKGKIDPLLGLKENVIIGKLIPAGTGMNRYRNVTPVPVIEENRDLLQSEAAE